MLSIDNVVSQVAMILRKGQSETQSGIYTHWIESLLPSAMINLTDAIMRDPLRRGLITTDFEVTLTDGSCLLTDASFKQLYRPGLVYSLCYDEADSNEAQRNSPPLTFIPDADALTYNSRYKNPNLAYYAIRDNRLITRGKQGNTITGPLRLFSPYIPNFSNSFPLPYELLATTIAITTSLASGGQG